MSKVQLKLEEDYDFDLVGISCHLKDYRLCYELNKELELDLQRDNDLVITKKDDVANYSLSLFIDDENHLEYYLIANKGTKGFLIPEQKSTDFFLMLKGVVQSNDFESLLSKMKQMEMILAAYQIEPNTLKSKANLLF